MSMNWKDAQEVWAPVSPAEGATRANALGRSVLGVQETTRGAKAGMSQGLGTLRERWEPLKGWSRGRRGLNGIWAGGRGWGAAHRPFGPFRQCTGFCPSPASVKPVSTQSGECPNPGEEDSTVTAIVGSCIVAPILRTRERYLLWTKGACQCGKVGIEMGKIF